MSIDFNFTKLTNNEIDHLKHMTQSKIDKFPILNNFTIDKFNINNVDPQIELRSLEESQNGLKFQIFSTAHISDLISISARVPGKRLNTPFYTTTDLSLQMTPDLTIECSLNEISINSNIDVFIKGLKGLSAESVFIKCDPDAIKELSLCLYLPPIATQKGISHLVRKIMNYYLTKGITIRLEED